MEFGFTEEQEKLRKEVHDWFANELPEDWGMRCGALGGVDEKTEAFAMEFQKKASAKGWPAVGWPKKYGGLGLTAMEQAMVSEEESYWGAPSPGRMGIWLVGPTILVVGTGEQNEKWIPPIIRGEVVWLEAFTEPNAGSDEANVQLRAVPDGDDYVLNGQKTFITGQNEPEE